MSVEKISSVKGGKSHKTFHVHYDAHNGQVYIQSTGGFFGGGKTLIRGQKASDAQHAVRIAQAHVTDK